MKTLITNKTPTAEEELRNIKSALRSKYFSYWMGKFEIPELSPECNNFIWKEIWRIGSVALTPIQEVKDGEGDKIIATPYAPTEFNIYNYPTKATLIQIRGKSGLIPESVQIINKNIGILWGHVSHMAISDIVEYYVDKLADIQMTINNHLFLQKIPRLIPVSPEDKSRAQSLINAIERGEHKLFIDINDMQSLNSVLDSGGSYVIDKLYLYKENVENELLTFLGIDNKGINKAERVVVDEMNSNNQSIIEGSDNFTLEINRCLKEIEKFLNIKLTLKENHKIKPMVDSFHDDNKEEEDDGNIE